MEPGYELVKENALENDFNFSHRCACIVKVFFPSCYQFLIVVLNSRVVKFVIYVSS